MFIAMFLYFFIGLEKQFTREKTFSSLIFLYLLFYLLLNCALGNLFSVVLPCSVYILWVYLASTIIKLQFLVCFLTGNNTMQSKQQIYFKNIHGAF